MNAQQIERMASMVLEALWRASWQAAVLVAIVLIVQWVLRQQLPHRWRHNLWLLVLLRLAIPVTPASPISIFNLTRHLPQTPATIPLAPRVAAVEVIAAPPPSAPAKGHIRWATVLFCVWAAGVTVLALRVARASLRLSRAVRRMAPVDDPKVLALLRRCANEVGVRTIPRVLTSPDLPAPALMGFWRPRLLLPAHVLSHFEPAELRLIALHELAHLKRHDVAINWLIAILQTLHWFNPVLWLAMARLRTDRELAADELVLSATNGADRNRYGQTIVKLLQSLSHRPHAALPGTIGILERAQPLRRRITMIAQFHSHRKSWSALAAVCMLLLAALALTDAVHGDDAPQSASLFEADLATQPRVAAATVPARAVVVNKLSTPDDAERTYAQFQRRLPEINMDNIALAEVIEFVRDVSEMNIAVNWPALEGAGIDPGTPISLRLKDVTLEQVLRQLIAQASGGGDSLAFSLDGNVIVISTADTVRARPRAYDVSDLLDGTSSDQLEQRVDRLRQVVMDNVQPDSWRDAGGAIGSIAHLDNKLIISTTDMNHLEIDRLLAEIRRMK